MNESEFTVPVELSIREIRALYFASTLLSDIVPAESDVELPDGVKVRALDSAAMKLEVSLMCERAEL